MSKLTERNIKFCEEYVANGYIGGQAYGVAYENDNLNSCRVAASDLLHKDIIIDKIKEIEGNYKILGLERGINKKMIIDSIIKMMSATKKIFNKSGELMDECPDSSAINNAIITWAKLTGEFEPEKKSITIGDENTGLDKDPKDMTVEEVDIRKAEILKEMQQ